MVVGDVPVDLVGAGEVEAPGFDPVLKAEVGVFAGVGGVAGGEGLEGVEGGGVAGGPGDEGKDGEDADGECWLDSGLPSAEWDEKDGPEGEG